MFFPNTKSVEEKVRRWRHSPLTAMVMKKVRYRRPYEVMSDKIIALLAQEKITVARADTILWLTSERTHALREMTQVFRHLFQ